MTGNLARRTAQALDSLKERNDEARAQATTRLYLAIARSQIPVMSDWTVQQIVEAVFPEAALEDES